MGSRINNVAVFLRRGSFTSLVQVGILEVLMAAQSPCLSSAQNFLYVGRPTPHSDGGSLEEIVCDNFALGCGTGSE